MQKDEDFMNEMDVEMELITLSQDLPHSYIVHEKYKGVKDFKEKYLYIAKDLFKKYVDYSSEFEINISGSKRQQVITFFDKYKETNGAPGNSTLGVLGDEDQQTLYSIYDDSCVTVRKLMSDSHRRWQNTFTRNMMDEIMKAS